MQHCSLGQMFVTYVCMYVCLCIYSMGTDAKKLKFAVVVHELYSLSPPFSPLS